MDFLASLTYITMLPSDWSIYDLFALQFLLWKILWNPSLAIITFQGITKLLHFVPPVTPTFIQDISTLYKEQSLKNSSRISLRWEATEWSFLREVILLKEATNGWLRNHHPRDGLNMSLNFMQIDTWVFQHCF